MRSIPYSRISRWTPSHYNPHKNIVVEIRRHRWELESGAGNRDEIDVFADSDRIYLLSMNTGLQYVGLAEYILEEKYNEVRRQFGDDDYRSIEAYAEVFIQADYELEEILGPRGLDLAPLTIVKKLIPYLGDG